MTATAATHLQNLAKAHEIRSLRASFRRGADRLAVRDALLNPPEWMETASVGWLLLCPRGIGRIKATAMLDRYGVSPSTKLRELPQKRRVSLAAAVAMGGGR